MNRSIAVIWLLFTLAPIAYLVVFVCYIFNMQGAPGAAMDAQRFNFLFRVHMTMIIGTWAVMATYIVYLFKTPHVPAEKRTLWAVVLFLGHMIAMPIFWYIYVWRPLQPHAVAN